jgi:hypothetical protein
MFSARKQYDEKTLYVKPEKGQFGTSEKIKRRRDVANLAQASVPRRSRQSSRFAFLDNRSLAW